MKVVMLGPFGLVPKGTVSVRALPMAQALARRGYRVTIILPPWDHPQDAGRRFEGDGVRIYNIALPPRLPLLQHLLIAWRMVRQALAERPEVIHCFKPKAYAGLAAMVIWLLKRLGLSRVRLVIDSDDWEGWGGWNEVAGYPWLQKVFFAWQERWGLKHCDAITVASRALETIVWSLGVSPRKVHYVPNGVVYAPFPDSLAAHENATTDGRPPTAAFPRHGDGMGDFKNGEAPLILLYTRFLEFRLERAVEIFRRVIEAMPQARLLVVGKGLSGEEERFAALMREAGLEDRLIYAGWVPQEELPSYFASATLAIYPMDDTLVNRAKCAVKLIDLLKHGMAVVADRVGQADEYIEHGVSGILVEPGDTAAFAQALLRLLRDEAERARLGENAARRVRERFSWDALIQRVEKAYLLAKPRTIWFDIINGFSMLPIPRHDYFA